LLAALEQLLRELGFFGRQLARCAALAVASRFRRARSEAMARIRPRVATTHGSRAKLSAFIKGPP